MSGLLGQAAPAAASWTDIYTCPADTVVTCRVIVTNRGATDTTFRIAASKGGAAVANEHSISYDKEIVANDTRATIGFAISASDVVRVYAGNTNLSFTLTGETRPE